MNLRTSSRWESWRALAVALLLVLCVQGLSLVPLFSHWACADTCETTRHCHSDAATDSDGCDPSCSCLGCPTHTGGLALLCEIPNLTRQVEGHAALLPPASPQALNLLGSVFRPPCV